MKSVFDDWYDVDVEEFIDADQDGDEETKQRIASLYGMNASDIKKVHFTIPPRPTLWQWIKSLFNRFTTDR